MAGIKCLFPTFCSHLIMTVFGAGVAVTLAIIAILIGLLLPAVQ
jgi:hypothetical protein